MTLLFFGVGLCMLCFWFVCFSSLFFGFVVSVRTFGLAGFGFLVLLISDFLILPSRFSRVGYCAYCFGFDNLCACGWWFTVMWGF